MVDSDDLDMEIDYFEGTVSLEKMSGVNKTVYRITNTETVIEVDTSTHLAFNRKIFSSKPFTILAPMTAVKVLQGEIPPQYIVNYSLSHYIDLRNNKGKRSEYEDKLLGNNYDLIAENYSSSLILVFLFTSLLLLFITENTVSIISGLIFSVVGAFVVSILFAMPFFFLEKIFRKYSAFISFIKIISVIVITYFTFSYFFIEEPLTKQQIKDLTEKMTVQCDEDIQDFTLGLKVIPTKEQKSKICKCIWESMNHEQQLVSYQFKQGNITTLNKDSISKFLNEFGGLVTKCNIDNI